MVIQEQLVFQTSGRSTANITAQISDFIHQHTTGSGMCNIFLLHTSASLILCENADPTVRTDLENFMQRLVKDGDPNYQHDTEGPDDMAAHIRTTLTHNSLSIPIHNGRLALGTWQGIFLWEHRYQSHRRKIFVTLITE